MTGRLAVKRSEVGVGKDDRRFEQWEPPRWLPLVLAVLFAVLIVVSLVAEAGWRTVSVLAGLFALCFKTAYSGYRPFRHHDSA